MHNIKNVEFSDIDFSNKDIILHLTPKEHEEDINKDGLIPQIGENSKDGLGYEKTPKVFFTKELDGSLMYVNKVLNIISYFIKSKDYTVLKKTSHKKYVDFLEKETTPNMTEQEETNLACKFTDAFLNDRIYYMCNLKGCTKNEYDNLSKFQKHKIDYLLDDIDEQTGVTTHPINNMHTIAGKGIPKEKLSKVTNKGNDNAKDIVMQLIRTYKEKNPKCELPSCQKDVPMLDTFYNYVLEQEKNKDSNDFITNLKALNNTDESRYLSSLKDDTSQSRDTRIQNHESI